MGEDLLFLDAIPSKVLMAFQHDILRMTEEERIGSEPVLIPSAIPTRNKTSEETNMCVERKEMLAEGQDTSASRIAIKASKADNAKVDTWIWDSKMVLDFPHLRLMTQQQVGDVNKTLRVGLANGWKDRMRTECLEYLRETHGFDWYSKKKETEDIRKDSAAIADVMHRVYHCDWWEWNQGSTLFFWRWHPEFKACARDGTPVWTLDK
jgi:hypothetical protein